MDESFQQFDGFFDAFADLLFGFCAGADDFAVLEQQKRSTNVFQAHDGAGKLFRLVFDVVHFHGDVEQIKFNFEVGGCDDVFDFECHIDAFDGFVRFSHKLFTPRRGTESIVRDLLKYPLKRLWMEPFKAFVLDGLHPTGIGSGHNAYFY